MTGVRFATYNLLHGLDLRRRTVDLDAVAVAIAGLDADVVAVQEVDRCLGRSGGVDQVAELAARLGRTGVFAPALLGNPTGSWRRGPGADPDPGGPAFGIGLLSALPVIGSTVTALPGAGPSRTARSRPDARSAPVPVRDEPRAALRATVASPWGRVAVTTAHLSIVPWRARRQLRTVEGLARCGPDEVAAVLLGDLNLSARVVGPVLRRQGWHATTAGPTFPSWRPLAQLDHLAVRGDVAVTDACVGPPGPSDHLPLSGTVQPRHPR